MTPTTLTEEILLQIRDEVRSTKEDLRAELRSTHEEIRSTNERLDDTNERLDRLARRQAESEVRISTELIAVQSAVREVVTLLRDDRIARRELDALGARVGALEKKVG